MRWFSSLAACLMVITAATATGLEVGDRVDNFKLLDHNGNAQELYYLADARAVALMAHAVGCDDFAARQARFQKLAATYGERGIAFLMLNSQPQVDRGAIASDIPVLIDDARIVGESLGVAVAGETLLVDTSNWRLAHRGAADLDDVLDDFLDGNEIAASQELPANCSLDLRVESADITYVDDVAPILAANCVTCHRQGGIGPWAMTDYNMVRGFAPMIREVIRTRRMPPWHADPIHGSFANDRSLTIAERRTIVHWAQAGAPRGEGADPLAAEPRRWPQWQIGEPDLVLDIPAFDVPASGVVEYQYQRVRNPLPHDVWVRGTAILPGDRAALHHVITSFSVPSAEQEQGGRTDALGNSVDGRASRRGGGLGGYVPGMVADVFPDNTGTLLPAGAVLIFQMHYTPYGKAVTDRSQLGLYFHETPPKHRLASAVLMNTRIRIPPNAKAHSDYAERTFKRDVLVYDLLPHAHYRGKASEFRAFYPDGREELLLSVPDYDFNWQTTYVLDQPKMLPAGTRVVHTTWWDNSAQNPANPDPNREVPWGRQSWDEMLFGAIGFRYLDDEELASNRAGEGAETSASAGD